MSKKEQIDRAWEYYKHADSLNATRFSFILAAEALLVGAFFAADAEKRPEICVLPFAGLLLSIGWLIVANNITKRLAYLSKGFLARDEIFKAYLKVISPIVTSNCVLTYIFPWIFIVVWTVVIYQGYAIPPCAFACM